MRLPHLLLDSPFFLFSSYSEYSKALGTQVGQDELSSIQALLANGLPPITSRHALATMFGVNPGLIWSMENRPNRHYRSFSIPKGNTVRRIDAPRVALKIIQKWLSVHLERAYKPPDHVFGFIKGRSHVQAAMVHVEAKWVFSSDIRNFFPTTPQALVSASLQQLGLTPAGADLIARLSCLRGTLAQGAPTSPVLSNLCFSTIDAKLSRLAEEFSVRLTRYADDLVFSSQRTYPEGLSLAVANLFEDTPWSLAEEKTELSVHPKRLKVHGLLVHGDKVRLTKGYRHRLRAYRHLVENDAIRKEDLNKVKGHLRYSDYINHVGKE